jgi:hypothetical protein
LKEAKALLVMTLVARRATAWAHDVIASTSINKGQVRDDAMRRFAADITAALAIIDEPDEDPDANLPTAADVRGILAPARDDEQEAETEAAK